MSEITVTKANFDALKSQTGKKVLLDFWAPWCGPCRMVAPIVAEIAETHPEVIVGKVNVDEELELARAYGIVSIPTLIVLSGGQVAAKAVGYMPKKDIEALLDK